MTTTSASSDQPLRRSASSTRPTAASAAAMAPLRAAVRAAAPGVGARPRRSVQRVEEARRVLLVEPVRRRVVRGRILTFHRRRPRPSLARGARVVAREAGTEPGPGPQPEPRTAAAARTRDCRAARPASRRRGEREADVVAHPVIEGQQAGQQRCVGRQARRGVGEARVNTVAPAARRSSWASTVAAVGSGGRRGRIDRDEEDGPGDGRGLAREPPAHERRGHHGHGEKADDDQDARRGPRWPNRRPSGRRWHGETSRGR